MIMTQCAARQAWTAAATEVRKLRGTRVVRLVLAVAMVAASLGAATAAGWVRVASSPDVQVFVDAGSLTKDSRGFVSVWTKTLYASVQTDVGIRYAADMTRFVLDCAGARYGIDGGKFLDDQGHVLGQFDEPAGELQPIPPATKIDAIAKAICTAG
ncbi:hypothetical protein AWB75_06509 [Caballeronia catudaia]|uniref:Surface-adhesin protein E-like domain-containing protein n=1 Tax=Caballeronia catudaia TaxID=1777136 RepID=A0A158DCY8_9BURK|nr:surface-adhesin E family protein [Caballeronia catudaia]SAK92106.1 hypothetical protein AWB75_06509 [Caballeronia catudaia]